MSTTKEKEEELNKAMEDLKELNEGKTAKKEEEEKPKTAIEYLSKGIADLTSTVTTFFKAGIGAQGSTERVNVSSESTHSASTKSTEGSVKTHESEEAKDKREEKELRPKTGRYGANRGRYGNAGGASAKTGSKGEELLNELQDNEEMADLLEASSAMEHLTVALVKGFDEFGSFMNAIQESNEKVLDALDRLTGLMADSMKAQMIGTKALIEDMAIVKAMPVGSGKGVTHLRATERDEEANRTVSEQRQSAARERELVMKAANEGKITGAHYASYASRGLEALPESIAEEIRKASR